MPMVDNYTHGAADAIAAGGVLVNASIEASRSGEIGHFRPTCVLLPQ